MSGDVHVEAVVSGRLAASTRFRVLQHVAPLGVLGIEVQARIPRISKYASVPPRLTRQRWSGAAAEAALGAAKVAVRLPSVAGSWRTDVTWLEREMVPGHLTLEPLLHQPVLFDVDDAIWLLSSGNERAVRATARRSACVMAGNDFLADWFSAIGAEVERVWTAIDTTRFVPAPASADQFVVGWTGSTATLHFLRLLEPALATFLRAAPDARLVVMADRAPTLAELPPGQVQFVPWTPATETTVPASFAVGLMPLRDTDWSRGKCAFKMLQYMACAVPAVVTPVGMNAQVLAMADVGLPASNEDEWVEALLALYGDRDLGRRLGQNGRQLAERVFSVEVIAPQLADVIRRYC